MDAFRKGLDTLGFGQALINSSASHIAIIDGSGAIIAVNDAWRKFGRQNSPDGSDYSDSNYFEVCSSSIENGDELAKNALAGIQEVSKGKRELFVLDYPCHSPDVKRWFTMRVVLLGDDSGRVILVHENITVHKLAEGHLRDLLEKLELEQSGTERADIALKKVLEHIDDERRIIEDRINLNRIRAINPLLGSLMRRLGKSDARVVTLIQKLIDDISSPFLKTISERYPNLTPNELQICSMIRSGFLSKEIAEVQGVSLEAIHKSRQRIRQKLGITNDTTDIAEFLQSI